MKRSLSTLIASVLCACALLPGAGVAAQPVGVETISRAVGSNRLASATVTLKGDAVFMGADGSFTMHFDGEGRVLLAIEGPISRSSGFDGHAAWEVGFNGIVRPLVLGDRDDFLLRAWVATGQWLLPMDDMLRVSAADDDVPQFHVTVGDAPFTGVVTIDPQTSLPQSLRYSWIGADFEVTMSDHRSHDGIVVPHRIEMTSSLGDVETLVVTEVAIVDEPRSYDAQRRAGNLATLDRGAAAELEVKVAPTGHLMVPARINGEDAGWFIFDSGAGANCISMARAEEFDLPIVGTTPLSGIGGSVDGSVFQANDFELGPLTMKQPILIGFDLSPFEPAFGVKLGGIIGYGMMSHAVVEYDMEQSAISLYDPETYELEGAEWADLMLYQRTCHTAAVVEGHRGPFLLDTGAAELAVMINAPAVTRLDLLESRSTTEVQVAGAGGAVPARAGEVAWVEVAGQRYENVSAGFATERVGAYGDGYVLGSIGGKILGDFKMIFDYAHGRLAFKR